MIDEIDYVAQIGKSDHVLKAWPTVDLCTQSEHWYNVDNKDEPKPNFNKANYQAMRSAFCDVKWEEEFQTLSSDEAWQNFKQIYEDVTDTHVPRKKTMKNRKPKWMK